MSILRTNLSLIRCRIPVGVEDDLVGPFQIFLEKTSLVDQFPEKVFDSLTWLQLWTNPDFLRGNRESGQRLPDILPRPLRHFLQSDDNFVEWNRCSDHNRLWLTLRQTLLRWRHWFPQTSNQDYDLLNRIRLMACPCRVEHSNQNNQRNNEKDLFGVHGIYLIDVF